MSTNFYLVRKANRVALTKLSRYQKSDDRAKLMQVCKEMTDGIHLGKHVHDYKFIVDYNKGKYFNLNRDSFIEFLNKTLNSGNWFVRTDNCISGESDMISFIADTIDESADGKVDSYTPSSKCKVIVKDNIAFHDCDYEWF